MYVHSHLPLTHIYCPLELSKVDDIFKNTLAIVDDVTIWHFGPLPQIVVD